MQADVITIGDEILIGQIVDTNSVYIAKALNKIGISVRQITSVQDTTTHILEALAAAKEASSIIIITGGLGPTKDDVTKHTFCKFFDDTLILNDAVLDHITQLFKQYVKKPMLEANKSQALVPSKAVILKNDFGTAPGMWMEDNGSIFISLPGVPYEMRNLMEQGVLPKLQSHFELPYILHKTILTYGMGESAIADRIAHFEENLPPTFKLAYLPSLGRVRLRLSTMGSDKATVDREMQELLDVLTPQLQDIMVGFEDDGPLEVRIAEQLTGQQQTLAIAESCTGGKLSSMFTQHAGASSYFRGSAVTYATDTKTSLLGVDAQLIQKHSVVSAPVVKAMALGVQKQFASNYAIATTGNAGPSKGDSAVEVGTVFIGIATPHGVEAHEFMMGNHRERVVVKSVNKALELLWQEILKN